MPENEKQDVRNEQADVPMVETKMQKYEREQMTRRAALRKVGYTSALAAFALFGVDDVVRLVGRRMQQQAGDNQVADLVARELKNAGVAIANTNSVPTIDCTEGNSGKSIGNYCSNTHAGNTTQAVCSECCGGVYRNTCSNSGVTWPFGNKCPSNDDVNEDGAECVATCSGTGYCG